MEDTTTGTETTGAEQPTSTEPATDQTVTETATVDPATVQPVEVTNWPAPALGTSQVVNLPSGQVLRVDYQVSFGDLLVSVMLFLALVVFLGSKLFDRIRGVL